MVLESEVTSLKEAGGAGFYQTEHLPEGMAVASSDVIASLNERLVQVLQVCICGHLLKDILHLYLSYC